MNNKIWIIDFCCTDEQQWANVKNYYRQLCRLVKVDGVGRVKKPHPALIIISDPYFGSAQLHPYNIDESDR